MDPKYKKTIEVAALVLYVFATIITCAAVWNSSPGAFISIVAAALFVANGFIIYRELRK